MRGRVAASVLLFLTGQPAVADPLPLASTISPIEKTIDPVSAAQKAESDRALDCMTAAIAYEAGNEPEPGLQAVGEVILNRTRNPAFPSSVCGVVFAGSSRRTGCQFTFTCDGSLNRRLSEKVLARSRAMASYVLSGQYIPVVAGATHYHASYVSPYWAPSLTFLGQIGLHRFYRAPMRDASGSPGGRVAGGAAPEQLASLIRGGASISGRPIPTASSAPPSRGDAFSPWGL